MRFIKLSDKSYRSECGTYQLNCARTSAAEAEREALWVAMVSVADHNRFLGGGTFDNAKHLCQTYAKLSNAHPEAMLTYQQN